jgi:hypothetical protein
MSRDDVELAGSLLATCNECVALYGAYSRTTKNDIRDLAKQVRDLRHEVAIVQELLMNTLALMDGGTLS